MLPKKLSPSKNKKKKKRRTDSIFDILLLRLRRLEQLAGAAEQLHQGQSCPEVDSSRQLELVRPGPNHVPFLGILRIGPGLRCPGAPCIYLSPAWLSLKVTSYHRTRAPRF